MYVGNDFTDATPNETRRYTFDFSNDLDDSEILTSAVWSVECPVSLNPISQDPSPMTHLSGSPSIDPTGKLCIQTVAGLLDGFVYLLRCQGSTNQNADIELYSHVSCIDPG